MRKSSGLPTRFPPGSKYVLESRGPLVHRYIELPNGRQVVLPARKAVTCRAVEASLVPKLEAAGEVQPPRAKIVRRRARVLTAS